MVGVNCFMQRLLQMFKLFPCGNTHALCRPVWGTTPGSVWGTTPGPVWGTAPGTVWWTSGTTWGWARAIWSASCPCNVLHIYAKSGCKATMHIALILLSVSLSDSDRFCHSADAYTFHLTFLYYRSWYFRSLYHKSFAQSYSTHQHSVFRLTGLLS